MLSVDLEHGKVLAYCVYGHCSCSIGVLLALTHIRFSAPLLPSTICCGECPQYRHAVSREIRELRGVLDALEARKNERSWLRHRDNGDLDDSRLIDGLTGDRNVYKMRGERPPEQGSTPVVPKRIHFLFDLSMSMSRYSMDGRLQVR